MDPIKRDVGQQAKGFRLQKLRAVCLMMDAIEKNDHVQIYCAIEHEADVNYVEVKPGTSVKYYEEDKNYGPETNFSFNSIQVLNTMVIFVDIWIKYKFSKNLVFGFYTTNGISKENRTGLISNKNLALPSEPVLTLLKEKRFSSELIDLLKTIVIEEYEKQYAGKKNQGSLELIKTWSEDDWIDFFTQIDWKLGRENEVDIEKELVTKIKKNRLYDQGICNKENLIISAAIDLFDKKQAATDVIERFVHGSDIKLIFHEVAARFFKLEDPAWEEWEKLKASDKRNLELKLKAVCERIDVGKLGVWSRKIGISLTEQKKLSGDKSLLSFKYRIFEVCKDKLVDFINQNKGRKLTIKEIEDCINDLVNSAKSHIVDISKNYTYTVQESDDFVKGIILWLIDSCYLAFDNGSLDDKE
jgi:hypothetical protein